MTRGMSVVLVALTTLALGCPPPSAPPTRLATGTTPNAVTAITCRDGPRLLVTASAEGRLDVLDPTGVEPPGSVFLGAGSAPWDVAVWRHADVDGEGAVEDEGDRVVVTLSGHHTLALVHPCGDAPGVMHVLEDPELLDVDPPVTLRDAEDVDGDGVVEREVTRMRPRAPQAVVVAGDNVVVGWANTLAFATGADAPMLTGPGLVARYVIDGVGGAERLRAAGRVSLPCENPGGLAVVDDDTVVASCAGRFAVGATGHEKAGPGGLARVSLSALVTSATTTLPATPGPLLVAAGALLSGDLLDGALHQHDPDSLDAISALTGRTDVIDSAFALVLDDEGAPVAGWFDGRVTSDPFGAGRTVSAPEGPPRGLVDLVHDGERLWGLHTLSAELVVVPEVP